MKHLSSSLLRVLDLRWMTRLSVDIFPFNFRNFNGTLEELRISTFSFQKPLLEGAGSRGKIQMSDSEPSRLDAESRQPLGKMKHEDTIFFNYFYFNIKCGLFNDIN